MIVPLKHTRFHQITVYTHLPVSCFFCCCLPPEWRQRCACQDGKNQNSTTFSRILGKEWNRLQTLASATTCMPKTCFFKKLKIHCKLLNPDGTAGTPACFSLSFSSSPSLRRSPSTDNRCPFSQPTADAQEHLDTEQQPARFQGRQQRERNVAPV